MSVACAFPFGRVRNSHVVECPGHPQSGCLVCNLEGATGNIHQVHIWGDIDCRFGVVYPGRCAGRTSSSRAGGEEPNASEGSRGGGRFLAGYRRGCRTKCVCILHIIVAVHGWDII